MNREQIEQEVARLADAWATAELQGDTAFLERLLSDDFIGVGPLGFLLSRQEWLRRGQSRDLEFTTHTPAEARRRASNDATTDLAHPAPRTASARDPNHSPVRTP